MNVATVLERRADEQRGATAIVQRRGRRDDTLTFGNLRAASADLAATLSARGVRAGDHVSLFTPVSLGLYVALIALLRVGAVPVVVDPGLGFGGMRRCLRRVRPKAVLGTRRTLAVAMLFPELWSAGKILVRTRARGHAPDIVEVDADAPALVTFTSGSTGRPKAVVRSHGLLLAQNDALAKVLAQTPGDVSLCTLPIFVLANLAEGVTSVIADADLRRPGFVDAGPIMTQIERLRPQSTVASPAFLLRLAEHHERGHVLRHRFDRVFTGGAPVFPATVDRLAPLTTTGLVVTVYGSTEAEPISHLEGLEPGLREAIRSGAGLPAGIPVDDVDVRIVTDAWGSPVGPLAPEALDAMTLGPDAPGEIIVAGDHVVRGYLDGVGDEETKIHVGDGSRLRVWHRTGDAGRMDADGGLWLLGRCAAATRVAGEPPLYPLQIEAAVHAATGCLAALTRGDGGPMLLVETGATPHAATRLEEARVVAGRFGAIPVRSIDRIPLDRRHNAKIEYGRLRELA